MRALVLVALVIALAFAAEEQQGKPFLVVRKEISETHVMPGKPLTVSVSVINFGQSPAFDVQISDVHPIDKQPKVNSVAKLDFNETLSLEYTVTADAVADLALPPAQVTYSVAEGDSSRLKALSNIVREEELVYRQEDEDAVLAARGHVHVITAAEYDRLNTKHIKEIAAYLFLAAIPVFFPFFIYRSKQNQIDHLLRESKKK